MISPTTRIHGVECALEDGLVARAVLLHCRIGVFHVLAECSGAAQSNSFIHIVEARSWPCFVSIEKQYAMCFVRVKSKDTWPVNLHRSYAFPINSSQMKSTTFELFQSAIDRCFASKLATCQD
ncbi:hypothetical protein D5086_021888 [Populus alba]|uniref:Uncharacterized protein n=1 Tax=Populus alba TaxID=43335 RepID=A0ACC4BDF4_POPAL